MTPVERANNMLGVCLFMGVTLLVVGGVIVGVGHPHQATHSYGVAATGSWGAVVTGGVIAAVGQMAVLVALIGYGVKLGIKASREVQPDTP